MNMLLIIFGLIIAGLGTLGFVDLIGFGCGMGTTGCRSTLWGRYFRHLPDPEGLVCLVIMAIAVALVLGGFSARRS
ncbi:hypothetical protein [Falsigemmobacter faecalis]|uniref:Uncharacterized protein n=1 Tax=Falsigemmobacter faecalis TaxID=2488730 RepID=A0A3P3D4Z0_9RHOB|nr:hypothetical protein [Falsigemmobacter faecalis]RRH68854.1 hypothetical protein EG244_19210 [Falsigemmobacter faecalis]